MINCSGVLNNIHGSYLRDDGSAYKYYGKYSSEFPLWWEAHVWHNTDTRLDVHKNFRAEISGELVNVKFPLDLLRALVIEQIEREISKMPAT